MSQHSDNYSSLKPGVETSGADPPLDVFVWVVIESGLELKRKCLVAEGFLKPKLYCVNALRSLYRHPCIINLAAKYWFLLFKSLTFEHTIVNELAAKYIHHKMDSESEKYLHPKNNGKLAIS